MSHIAFESGQGRVEIGGAERARMGGLIDDLAWVMHRRGQPRSSPQEENGARLRWLYDNNDGSLSDRLGWVSLIGDDVMKLLCHIHGQCEIHGWVQCGPTQGDYHGQWFADLIEQAVERGLLNDDRPGQYGRWQEVADLARRSSTPLVSSYSVTVGWPDPLLIARERPDLFTPADYDDPWESWSQLPEADQDRISDEAISSCAPQWHPSEWGIFAERVTGRSPWKAGVAP